MPAKAGILFLGILYILDIYESLSLTIISVYPSKF